MTAPIHSEAATEADKLRADLAGTQAILADIKAQRDTADRDAVGAHGEATSERAARAEVERKLAIAVEALRHYADTPVSGVAERALAAIEAPAKADDDIDPMTCPIHPDTDKEVGWDTPPPAATEGRPSDALVEYRINRLEAEDWNNTADDVRRLLAHTKRLEAELDAADTSLSNTAERTTANHKRELDEIYERIDEMRTERNQLRAQIGDLATKASNLETQRDMESLENDQLRAQLAEKEAARAQAQEWLDRFQDHTVDRDMEILKLRGQLAKATEMLHTAPDYVATNRWKTEGAWTKQKWIDWNQRRVGLLAELRRTLDTTDTGEKK